MADALPSLMRLLDSEVAISQNISSDQIFE